MDNEMNNLVVDYVLENENNLRLAYKVNNAFNDIKGSIYKEFLLKLQQELNAELGKNEIKITNEFYNNPLDAYEKFFIRKIRWPEKYSIAFGANKKQKIYFGIYNSENTKTNLDIEISNQVDRAIINNITKSFEEDYWIWEIYLNDEYGNWSDEEVLVSLWEAAKGKNLKVLDYFKELIIQVINTMDSLL